MIVWQQMRAKQKVSSGLTRPLLVIKSIKNQAPAPVYNFLSGPNDI